MVARNPPGLLLGGDHVEVQPHETAQVPEQLLTWYDQASVEENIRVGVLALDRHGGEPMKRALALGRGEEVRRWRGRTLEIGVVEGPGELPPVAAARRWSHQASQVSQRSLDHPAEGVSM